MCETPDIQVYCSDCKHFHMDKNYNISCYKENECYFYDFPDSRRISFRKCWEMKDYGSIVKDLQAKLESYKELERFYKREIKRRDDKLRRLRMQVNKRENRVNELSKGIRKIEDMKKTEVQQVRKFWMDRCQRYEEQLTEEKYSFTIDRLNQIYCLINNANIGQCAVCFSSDEVNGFNKMQDVALRIINEEIGDVRSRNNG